MAKERVHNTSASVCVALCRRQNVVELASARAGGGRSVQTRERATLIISYYNVCRPRDERAKRQAPPKLA